MNCTNNTWSEAELAEVDVISNTTLESNVSTSPLATVVASQPFQVDYVIVSYFVIGGVGILGNAFCCAVIVAHKPLRARLANYYIINQCVLDLFISFFLLTNTTTIGNFVVTPDLLGALSCFLWKNRTIMMGFLASSTFNIVSLTIERYFEVVHPIKHKLYFNRKIVFVSLAAVWISGFLQKVSLGVSNFVVTPSGKCLTGVLSSISQGTAIVVANFLSEYFFDMVIIACCYIRMGRRMMRSIQPSGTSSSSKVDQDSMALRARKNIMKTLLSVVVSLALTGGFKHVLYLGYGIRMFDVDWNGNVYKISVILQFSNCCINPFIYMFQYKEFQKGVVALYRVTFKRPGTSVAVTQSSSDRI